MQGIELVAIFSLLSSLFSLFSAPSSLLSSALDSRNRIPAFLQGIMRPRGVLHCKNEAIRGGPGANKPCCQSIWGSLAAFFVISSLFSLLASLAAARPGKVQTLLQYSCSLFLQGSSRFSLRSSLVSPRARPFSLPSRPSGTEPSLFSLLSSLFPLLSLLLFSQIPLGDCHFDLCIRPSTAR